MARPGADARHLRHLGAGDAGGHDLDAGQGSQPRVAQLAARRSGPRTVDGRGPVGAGRRPIRPPSSTTCAIELAAAQSSQDRRGAGRPIQGTRRGRGRAAGGDGEQAKRRPISAASTQSLAQLESAENGSDEAADARSEAARRAERFRPRGTAPREHVAERKEVPRRRSNGGRQRPRHRGRRRPADRRNRSADSRACRQDRQLVDADAARTPRTIALRWKTVVKEIQADELELEKQHAAIETELERLQRTGMPGQRSKHRANGSTGCPCSTPSTPATSSSTRFGCRT